jgi:uncharacterized membrane protein YgcG
MGAKVNIDVEDGDGNGDEDEDWDDDDDIDQMFDQIEKESHVNEEHSSSPVQQETRPIQERQVISPAAIHVLSTLAGSCRAVISSTATVFNNATEVLTSLTPFNHHSNRTPFWT